MAKSCGATQPGADRFSYPSDGLTEAVRFAGKRFVLGVQWHPEAYVDADPFSRAIFAEFGRRLHRA